MADIKMKESADTFELPESSNRERQLQEALLRELETKRKIKSIVVPTDDGRVRVLLRQLGDPVTLFGEREMERRERLKKIIATREGDIDIELPTTAGAMLVDEAPVQTDLFYTEGGEALKKARLELAGASLRHAQQRLAQARALREDSFATEVHLHQQQETLKDIRHLAQQSSEIGGDRPISGCEFSPDGGLLATCGWGGGLSVWSSPQCKKLWSITAHEERCTGVAWHPAATASCAAAQTSSSGEAVAGTVALATSSADCSARLFDGTGRLIRKLEGHSMRLGRLAFHPFGRHLGTASYDLTWRMWDLETGACLLEQEGHSRAVYSIAFHPDGSLAASVGLDAYGRVWDLRTGRSVYTMEGHVMQILSVDFSPNGHHLVTGSGDHTCKIWDLRTKKLLYTMPGHRSLVSSVKYERKFGGSYLLSGAYDCVAKVWSARDFSLLKTLAGHEGKVMGCDVAADGNNTIATVSYDRTIKIWSPERTDMEGMQF